ncbi:MAG TPA: polysaccharide export protein [Nitrospirae bacterium]|nr:polysaccharide export protein [Nitrospirota bacterium]HDH11605.1 polysaccharide export protein [Nitrospirota bacterium]HDZ02025.1 polysaccharide export protein [Nitrospirota bacterium]
MYMKIRIPYFLAILITFFVWPVLLGGCASTGKKVEDISDTPSVSDDVPEEIKITEFILGAGDTIEIAVYRHDDLKRSIRIDTSGIITYPLVGDIKAAGLGILQFRDDIRAGLSKYIVNPQVSVNVTSVQSRKFSVLGEVKTPGIFSLESPTTFLEAMAKAGGFTIDAKQENVLLIRGGVNTTELVTLNLEEALKEGDLEQNGYVRKGDVIYVPATIIANVSRYAQHISKIIAPMLSLEQGYFIGQQIEAASGSKATSRTTSITVNPPSP